jgi:hypothetical protein
MFKLIPNPGVLPIKPAPRKGQQVSMRVRGMPPYKDLRASIRNPAHRIYARFVALREAAITAMAGRAWSNGAITLSLTIYAASFEKNRMLNDYLAGVMDTLDGSHGDAFTYLPICFQDDCQVCSAHCRILTSQQVFYEVKIHFGE